MRELIQQINDFTTEELEQIQHGDTCLLLQDDVEILLVPPQTTAVLYSVEDTNFANTQELQQYLVNNIDELLVKFYTQNSLGLRAFNVRISAITDELGIRPFIKTPNNPHTLVFSCEKGIISAIDSNDYRFKYGLYLELTGDFDSTILHNHFNNWLQSKTAYQDYLSVYFSTFL